MGFETVQAMYDDMRSRLDLQRLMAYDQAKEKGAREELAKRLPGEIPDVMIKARAKSLATDFNNRLQGQGLTLDQYIGMTGVSKEVFEEQILSDAEALFRELGMEVTDEDMDRELQDMAQASGESMEETRAKWEKLGLNAVVAEGVMHRRAVGWLMENVEVDERPDEPAAEPEAAEGTKKATKKRAPKKKPETAEKPESAESETAPADDQS
jgi:trigger factor